MNKWKFAGVLYLLSLVNFAFAQKQMPHFLEGAWKMENRESYEYWSKLSDNNFRGFSYQMKNGEMKVSEYLDISIKEGNVVYTATVINQNQGQGVPFTLTPADSAFVFENPEHDFPKKIVYKPLNESEIQVFVSDGGTKGFSYKLLKVKSQSELQIGKSDSRVIPFMVLGTYHFSNPGKDMMNIQSDDILSEKRQQELEELKHKLARFKPTKIAFEHPFSSFDEINEAYQQYSSGADLSTLGRSEDYQIVFRLAKELGHDKVYPIDFKMGDFSKVQAFVAENPTYAERLNNQLKETAKIIADANEKLQNSTVSEFLYFLNEKRSMELNHEFYAMLKSFGKNGNYAGPEVVADWYKRNMIIFNNLTQIVDNEKEERILVVFGQGHAKLLRDFIAEYPGYRLVDVNNFLK